MATNPLIERQISGFLIRNPDKISAFPRLETMIVDPAAKFLLDLAIKRPEIGANPAAIAAESKGAYSAKEVLNTMLIYSSPEYLPDPHAVYSLLQNMSQNEDMVKTGREALLKLEAGRISRQEYFKVITEKYSHLEDMFQRNSLDTRKWAEYGKKRAAFYKDMTDKGLLLYMPRMWPTIRNGVGPLIFGTLIVIIGPTGGGKSIAAEQLAYEWAFECGHNVLFANTELTNDQEMWRYMLKYWPLDKQSPSIQQFQQGYWDSTCDMLAERFAGSRGAIRFIESSGASAEDLVGAAIAFDAHIIVDYADMLYKDPRVSETQAVANMMTIFKNYAQTYGRIVVVIQQVTKQASQEMRRWINDLEGDAAMGSARFIQRSNLMLSLNFGRTHEVKNLRHPITHELIKIPEGEQDPEGYMRCVKSTFSRAGAKWNMFLDGASYRLLESSL